MTSNATVLEAPANPANPFRGVSYHTANGLWRAKIKTQGRHVHLGYYVIAEDGARVFDVAAHLLRGGAAELNFDGNPPQGVSEEDVRAILVRAGVL